MGIENRLLDIPLINLKDPLTKGKDDKIRPFKYGQVGAPLIQKEGPPNQFNRSQSLSLKMGTLPIIVLIIILFTLAMYSGYFYLNNQSLKREISSTNELCNELTQQNSELLERLEYLEMRLKYHHLWNGEIELVDPRWKYPGRENRTDMSKYTLFVNKFVEEMHVIPGLEEVYVHRCVDWLNGTAYVVLSDLSPEFTEPILDLFGIYVAENIRFIKAPAPPAQMNKWRNIMMSLVQDELLEAGIQWSYMGTYYNGKIQLGVTEITPTTIDTITDVIKEHVPPGIIVIEEADQMIEL